MAYEKKIEPISRWEYLACGLSLQLWLIFNVVLPWSDMTEECFDSLYSSDIKSSDDMSTFHNCIIKYRSNFLIGCTAILLGYPFIISHLYFYHRISETVDSFLNFGLSNWLYIISWGVSATIYCTIIPGLGIFLSYYDWELSSSMSDSNVDSQYIGYTMQYQFFAFWCILWDCLIIPIGFASAMPWCRAFVMLFGYFPSKFYKVSETGKQQMLGKMLMIPCGKCIFGTFLAVIILMLIIGSLGDALDFAKDGFFSYDGASQFLNILIWLVIQLQIFWYYKFWYQFHDNIKFLNSNVAQNDENQ